MGSQPQLPERFHGGRVRRLGALSSLAPSASSVPADATDPANEIGARHGSVSEHGGIGDDALAARRAIGVTQHGPGFLVWDEDAETATRWADELRDAAASRPAANATEVHP